MNIPIKYSQNYLVNKKLVKYLMYQICIEKDELLIEIGPGKGGITEELLGKYRNILAIEKDQSLCEFLRNRFSKNKNINFINEDFLYFDIPKEKYNIISNIPFFITAQIMKKILDVKNIPNKCYLIMQYDAAVKYIGQPEGAETMMSIMNKPFVVIKKIYTFKSKDFSPEPKVSIVLIEIKKKDCYDVDEVCLYKDFIAYGFSKYKNNIKETFVNIFDKKVFEEIADKLSFSLESNPTDLTYSQWLNLFKAFLENKTHFSLNKIKDTYEKLKLEQSFLKKRHRTRRF